MSTDPEYDRVVTLDHPNGQDSGHQLVPPEAPAVMELPAPAEVLPTSAEAIPTPALEPVPVAPPVAAKTSRPRPRWLVPAAIAVVGLIASGTLGYL